VLRPKREAAPEADPEWSYPYEALRIPWCFLVLVLLCPKEFDVLRLPLIQQGKLVTPNRVLQVV
jgi:hypothetical protein